MTEKVCRCDSTDSEKTEKSDSTKTKEKLRLFSRKKSNSLNKNICSKCGLSMVYEVLQPDMNPSKAQPGSVSDRVPPTQPKDTKKTTRRQSEELPQIPVQTLEKTYEKYNGESVGVDCIYTEIREPPEKAASVAVPAATFEPLPVNRRRPPSGVGVRGQPPPSQLSNGFGHGCDCPKCRRQRGEDLTVELLPMDTQVTLQSMMQGATLMCNLL